MSEDLSYKSKPRAIDLGIEFTHDTLGNLGLNNLND